MRTQAWLPTLFLCALPALSVCTFAPAPAHAQAGAATPSPDEVKKAQDLFEKGLALRKAKKYALALEQFRASYATVPSPNSRLNIARCMNELGDHVDAYLEFTAVADEASARAATEPRYAKTRDTAILERDEVAKKIAVVTVTVEHPEAAASLKIGGREAPRDTWGKPFPAKPGPVEVIVYSTAGPPVTENVETSAGDKKDVTIDAQAGGPVPPEGGNGDGTVTVEPPSSREGLRPFAYIAGGIGLVGFGVFTVAGIMANGTYSDLEDKCGTSPCPPEYAEDVDSGKTQQTIANVGLIVGAVGIAAGATLFVLSITGGDSSAEPQADSTSAQLLVGPGYAGVRGTF
jgi:hypothetical protein